MAWNTWTMDMFGHWTYRSNDAMWYYSKEMIQDAVYSRERRTCLKYFNFDSDIWHKPHKLVPATKTCRLIWCKPHDIRRNRATPKNVFRSSLLTKGIPTSNTMRVRPIVMCVHNQWTIQLNNVYLLIIKVDFGVRVACVCALELTEDGHLGRPFGKQDELTDE